MIDPNLDHVGIIVPDVDAAMETLTAQLGVEWVGVFEPLLAVHDDEHGRRDIKMKIAVTVQRPFLELIQAVPDTPWVTENGGLFMHHLGYFVDDLAADSAAISGPCPLELSGVGQEGDMPRTFTYHVHQGLRFELLERRTGTLA